MKKIAFIVQRYGLEVNGGAEYHCRILAERLTSTYEVDVLTSCAQDYISWANWYPATTSTIHGVQVRRFATEQERQSKVAGRAEHKLKKWSRPTEWQGLRRIRMWARALVGKTIERYSEIWIKAQGPYMPDLIQYLEQNHKQYDALIFFTYLYYPTIRGLTVAPQKSILIPTAHDEPPIYLPVFRNKNLFSLPKAILYNTTNEKDFVNQMFHNESVYSDIVGVGIEPGQPSTTVSAAEIIGTEAPYLIYVGRVDPAKGCNTLFEYFIKYKKENPSALKLVLVGQAFMTVPEHADIISVGFVDEDIKITLLQGAKALVISSLYESLSMVTLESLANGIPVIANRRCEVIKDHIESSQAGELFADYDSFALAVKQILNKDLSEMAARGKQYIKQYYTWPNVLSRFAKAVDYVSKR